MFRLDMPEHWPNIIERTAIALMLAAGVLIMLAGLARFLRRRRDRRYCPGRRGRPWSLIHPMWWVIVRRCGYDLSGHGIGQPDRDLRAAVLCPECGCTVGARRHLRRRPWQFGLHRLAVGVALLSGLVALTHPVIQIRFTRRLPSEVLLRTERLLGSNTPWVIRAPLRWRLDGDRLGARHVRAMVPLLVDDLRADRRRHNAHEAMDRLRGIGEPAMLRLQAGLESDDWQQRQLAAYTLGCMDRGRHWRPRDFACDPPSVARIRVAVEGLGHDGLPYDRIGNTYISMRPRNARNGVRYLVQHAVLAETALRRAVESEDAQQRLLAAGVLGLAGRTSSIDLAMPILLEHLADNRIGRDAVFAACAIDGFGAAARPYLDAVLESDDDQQRGLARFLHDKHDPARAGDDPATYDVPLKERITHLSADPTARWLPIPGIRPTLVTSAAP